MPCGRLGKHPMSDRLSVFSGSRLCRDRVFCLSPPHLPKLLGAPAHFERLQNALTLASGSDDKIAMQQKKHAYTRHTYTYSFNTCGVEQSDSADYRLFDSY